ncbi:hypothetical protein [Paenibacillus sp. SYP-B3998]|nr:hypothetical protein [Paenibacillus sp. SYP-B3998]
MNNLWQLLTHHWLSIALILGALVAVWYVYKHKDKLLMDSSDK